MSNPVRILLIDDNPVDRARMLQELAQDFPDLLALEVSEEPGFAKAMKSEGFDLVLCDYALPWTDGLALLRIIKARWPAVPVIMVTGSGNEEIAIEAIRAGLDDYILKSAKHLSRLPSAVRSALDRVEQRYRLEEVETRYRALFDRVPVGLYRATPAGEFLDVNPALVDILGYPNRETLMAVHTSDLYVDPDNRLQWQRQANRDGLVRDFEMALRRQDGSIAWLRNSARAVQDATGRIFCYEGSLEDITERKRAETALARRMRQLEGIRAATHEITRELELAALLHLIGRRALELVGATSGGVFLWDDAGRRAAPRAWFGEDRLAMNRAWRSGEGVVGTVAERRKGMIVSDGASAPYALTEGADTTGEATVMAEPLICGDACLGVVVVVATSGGQHFAENDRHILGLFAAQAAVAMENARLFGEVSQARQEWENTFNAAADMIAVMDAECRILRVNQALAAYLHSDPTAVIGRRYDEVFHWCGAPPGDGALARCVASGEPVTEERTIADTGRVFLQTYSPFLDTQGRLRGVIQVSKDVTTQRQLQQQLSQSEKMAAMGRLISGVAHELNNPLTAVFGNAQLLVLSATDEVTRERAEVLVSEANRAAKIVRNLLTFARPYKPERRSVLLSQLIDDVVNVRKRELSVRGIAVVRTEGAAMSPVLADPHQIQQVLVNLLTNAEQALGGRSGGVIRIGCHVEPGQGYVKVVISDNGPGIPPDVLGRVFDPFFTTKEAGTGTGLGLAICYAIVREHGGQIRAGNRAEGGAWFEFSLPMTPAAVPPAPTESAISGAGVPAPGTAGTKQRVLVVDDEDAIVRVVAGALGMVGHHVEVAKDGHAAAEKLARGDFDLVLMDMKMPGFDGERIYEEVIRRKATPPRVIIMTGDTVNSRTRRFLDRTGLRCVEKPFKLEDIWDCVRNDGPVPSASTDRSDPTAPTA